MISLADTEPFTPQWREKEQNPPRYFIHVGDVLARGQLEALLSGKYRAGRVFGFQMVEAFTQGVAKLMEGDPDKDRLIELAQAEGAGEIVADDERQLLIRARDVLTQYWPEYASLLEQADRRRELAPILAFRQFVVGWENVHTVRKGPDGKPVPVEHKRGIDGLIPLDVLGRIDPLEMMAVGHHTYDLLYGGGEERNFPQPSKSDAAPQTSSSDDLSKAAAGKSAANGGKKTRGSPSRRGSGRS